MGNDISTTARTAADAANTQDRATENKWNKDLSGPKTLRDELYSRAAAQSEDSPIKRRALNDPAADDKLKRADPLPGWKVGNVAVIDLGGFAQSYNQIFPQEQKGFRSLSDIAIKDGQEFQILKIGQNRTEVRFMFEGKEMKGWVENSFFSDAQNKDAPLSIDKEFAERAKNMGPLLKWKIGDVAVLDMGAFSTARGEVFPQQQAGFSALSDAVLQNGQEIQILKFGPKRSEIRFMQEGEERKGWVENSFIERNANKEK